jgi:hypothetical protein
VAHCSGVYYSRWTGKAWMGDNTDFAEAARNTIVSGTQVRTWRREAKSAPLPLLLLLTKAPA